MERIWQPEVHDDRAVKVDDWAILARNDRRVRNSRDGAAERCVEPLDAVARRATAGSEQQVAKTEPCIGQEGRWRLVVIDRGAGNRNGPVDLMRGDTRRAVPMPATNIGGGDLHRC